MVVLKFYEKKRFLISFKALRKKILTKKINFFYKNFKNGLTFFYDELFRGI